jgi:hypothetical protein
VGEYNIQIGKGLKKDRGRGRKKQRARYRMAGRHEE